MTLTQSQMRKLQNLKSELGYSRIEHLLSQHFEQELEKEVSKLFQEMEYQVIQNLTEYYNPEVMFKAHMDLILAPIHELHKKYYEILIKYKIREFDKSRAAGKRIVERMIGFRRKGNVVNRQFTVLKAEIDLNDMVSSTISKDKLFGTSPIAHDNLRTRTYQLSEKTLARVDDNINDIITRGYDKGDGINAVANKVRRRFGQLETWEAKRIARTEIHNSQSLGVLQGYDDMGVQYIEWSSARDDRVRGLKPRDQADHYHLDGEIIQLGGVFSNGLMYPGDMNGPAKEVINCRCQVIPFIPPYGYIPPVGMAQFRESDLIATLDVFNRDELIAQALAETEPLPQELSNEQLNAMSFQELADHFGLEYRGEHYDIVDKCKKHMFVEVFEDGRRMSITFESDAIESYTQKGIATPNEIIAEIMKVPKCNRNETSGILFRNTNKGLGTIENGVLVDDVLDANTLGYNRTRIFDVDGYEHRIIVNPRFFKGSKGPGSKFWIPDDENIIRWKKNIHHEFEHSGDETKELFESDEYMPLCWSDEYYKVHSEERYFTEYANSERGESWAEHGGYISYMEANPSEQHRLITIQTYDEEQGFIDKKINYAEYKKMYPKHYEFFMKKHRGEMKFNVLNGSV